MADVAYVDSTTGAATSGTAPSAAAPTGIVAGDILIAHVHLNGTGSTITLTDNNGATPFTDSGLGKRTYNSDSAAYFILYRVAGGSEPSTYNWTKNEDNRWVVNISAYRNGDIVTIFDVAPTSGSENVGTSTTAATDAITTLTNGAMVVAVGMVDSNTVTFTATPGDSFTSRENNSGEELAALADKPIPTVATQASVSWTLSASNGWATNILAIKRGGGIKDIIGGTGVVPFNR